MSTTCWNKCIDRPKDGELSLGENACIDRCAAKFWQVATIIGNQMVAGAVQGGMQKWDKLLYFLSLIHCLCVESVKWQIIYKILFCKFVTIHTYSVYKKAYVPSPIDEEGWICIWSYYQYDWSYHKGIIIVYHIMRKQDPAKARRAVTRYWSRYICTIKVPFTLAIHNTVDISDLISVSLYANSSYVSVAVWSMSVTPWEWNNIEWCPILTMRLVVQLHLNIPSIKSGYNFGRCYSPSCHLIVSVLLHSMEEYTDDLTTLHKLIYRINGMYIQLHFTVNV